MIRRRATDDRGAMAVEFGVMFPVVALLIFGAIWFGLVFSAQLALTQAAREAVRVYALGSGDPVAIADAAYAGPGTIDVTVGLVDGGICDPLNPGIPAGNAFVLVEMIDEAGAFDIGPFPAPTVQLSSQAVMRCGG